MDILDKYFLLKFVQLVATKWNGVHQKDNEVVRLRHEMKWSASKGQRSCNFSEKFSYMHIDRKRT